MSTVTIYTETHRQACIYGLDEDDARVYNENVEKYFKWLEQQAEKEGITIEYEQSLQGASYYADDAEAEDFMLRSLDFWEWY